MTVHRSREFFLLSDRKSEILAIKEPASERLFFFYLIMIELNIKRSPTLAEFYRSARAQGFA